MELKPRLKKNTQKKKILKIKTIYIDRVKVVEKHCNITYSDDMIYVILKKKLGLTHKKGKGFYAEAKPEVREKFVEDLKKNSMNLLLKMFFYLKTSAV